MRRFAPGWSMSVLVALVLPVLVALGFWQLDRAEEKLVYQNRYLNRAAAAPLAPPRSFVEADFQRLRLSGEYLTGQHYLVDNRVHRGRPGYWVITRFAAADGRIYLLNRGWIAAPPARDQLPGIPEIAGPVEVVGVVWPDTGLPPLLAPDPWPRNWPKRVQRLDVGRMSAEGEAVVPAEIRVEAGQPGALVSTPLDVDFHPERHQGYAVQWFGLAVVLTVGYVVFALKRGQGEET